MENKKYILEGVFVQFGDIVNKNNGRIYRTEDYLPHIRNLKRKIKIKNILNG